MKKSMLGIGLVTSALMLSACSTDNQVDASVTTKGEMVQQATSATQSVTETVNQSIDTMKTKAMTESGKVAIGMSDVKTSTKALTEQGKKEVKRIKATVMPTPANNAKATMPTKAEMTKKVNDKIVEQSSKITEKMTKEMLDKLVPENLP